MGLLTKLKTKQTDHDREKLAQFCSALPQTTTIGSVETRQEATVAGEITSLRIVPSRDGSPWLEATLQDGTGALTVLWTGRRKIAGVRPGARMMVSGRAAIPVPGKRPTLYNPRYELIG